MTELAGLQREVASLQGRNEELLQRALSAEQAVLAIARGEVDAVAVDSVPTPLLLQAAQDKLRRSEHLLRAIFDGSLDAMLLADDGGAFLDANPAACELFGLPLDQLIGRRLAEFAAPESDAKEFNSMLRGRGKMRGEFPLLRLDGRKHVVEYTAVANVRPGVHMSVLRDVTERVAAEAAKVAAQHELTRALGDAALARSKLEAVLAALPVGVWIADSAGQLIETNPAAARIWGGSAPLVGGAEYGVYRAFWPETGKQLAAEDWALARTFKTGETIVAEAVEIERFDGTRGHVLNSTAPILDPEGKLLGGVVVILDVTDTQRTSRERDQLIVSLEHERGRLGMLLETAPAFIAVLRGENHTFELANDAYRELTGRRELIGKPLCAALPEIEAQGFITLLDDVLRTGNPFSADCVPVHVVRQPEADPELRYVSFLYQALVEVDGSRSGVFVHGIDVTDQTITAQRVRAQFHAVPVPTYVWQRVDRNGIRQLVLVDFNQAALIASNGTIEAQLGQTASLYYADEPSIVEGLERCLVEGVTLRREIDLTRKATGEQRRACVTFAAAPPDLVIVHAEDITDRSQLEEQLRQAQKMEAIGQLAGGVAHDFNNLLSVILSYASLALSDLKTGDPLRDDLTEIQTAGERATALTRQLLAFSRQQVLEPRVLDLKQIVDGMKSMLGRLLGEDIELTSLVAPGLWHVLADPGQIEQVVMNLAVNARDAMPEGGKLTMELSNATIDAAYVGAHAGAAVGEYVLLAVSDTGVGIDAETQGRIFDPFFTTKEKGKGTGLGLSTVFGIVKQSRGHITVASEPGRGTVFSVYLPRSIDAADCVANTRPPSAVGGSETILLVEDEKQVRTVACAILRRSGYSVIEAANGGEAFIISSDFAGKIDLLLTDVVMPQMGGRHLFENLVPYRPQMVVLYTSGYTDDAIVHHNVLTAGTPFLHKPFTPAALLSKVREVLDAARARLVPQRGD